MAVCLKAIGLKLELIDTLEKHYFTECVIFFCGVVLTVIGFYFGCKIELSNSGESFEPYYGLLLLLLGAVGLVMMASSLTLYVMAEERHLSVQRQRRRLINNNFPVALRTHEVEPKVEEPPPFYHDIGLNVPKSQQLLTDDTVNLIIYNPTSTVRIF